MDYGVPGAIEQIELLLAAGRSGVTRGEFGPPVDTESTEVGPERARRRIAWIQLAIQHERSLHDPNHRAAGASGYRLGAKVMQLTREALELRGQAKDERPVELLGLPAASSDATADPLVGSEQLIESRCSLLPPAVQCVGTQRWRLLGRHDGPAI
jgi:hypothetical protein